MYTKEKIYNKFKFNKGGFFMKKKSVIAIVIAAAIGSTMPDSEP